MLLGKTFSRVTFQNNILGLCVWPMAPDTGEAGVVVGVSKMPLYSRIPAVPPHDLCLRHQEWREFTIPNNPVLSMATNTHTDIASYTCNVE